METANAIKEKIDKDLQDIKTSYEYYSSIIKNRSAELTEDMKKTVNEQLQVINDNYENARSKSSEIFNQAKEKTSPKINKENIRSEIETRISKMQSSLNELDRKVADAIRKDT